MCNRYRMNAKQAETMRLAGFEPPYSEDEVYPPPELFPKRPAWVVRGDSGRRVRDVARWGFPHQVPGKRIDKATGKPVMLEKQVTNVRNYASSFWRSALVNPERRCLVPFTEFSEYGPGPKGAMPLYWFSVPSRPVACFAGVWRPLADGSKAFAFLTCEPNPLVAPIHPKAMPVILHDEDEERWLTAPLEEALTLAQPFPAQLMRVSDPVVGSARQEEVAPADED